MVTSPLTQNKHPELPHEILKKKTHTHTHIGYKHYLSDKDYVLTLQKTTRLPAFSQSDSWNIRLLIVKLCNVIDCIWTQLINRINVNLEFGRLLLTDKILIFTECLYMFKVINLSPSLSNSRKKTFPTTNKVFVCMGFFVPLENFSLKCRRHHDRWRMQLFWPMLGTYGNLAVRVF